MPLEEMGLAAFPGSGTTHSAARNPWFVQVRRPTPTLCGAEGFDIRAKAQMRYAPERVRSRSLRRRG